MLSYITELADINVCLDVYRTLQSNLLWAKFAGSSYYSEVSGPPEYLTSWRFPHKGMNCTMSALFCYSSMWVERKKSSQVSEMAREKEN